MLRLVCLDCKSTLFKNFTNSDTEVKRRLAMHLRAKGHQNFRIYGSDRGRNIDNIWQFTPEQTAQLAVNLEEMVEEETA